MISMIIIMAWEITTDKKGVLNAPKKLDRAYRKVCDFWGKIFY